MLYFSLFLFFCDLYYRYSTAFALTAGVNYDTNENAELSKHVTNLSVNKHISGHPGQIPVHLAPSNNVIDILPSNIFSKILTYANSRYLYLYMYA